MNNSIIHHTCPEQLVSGHTQEAKPSIPPIPTPTSVNQSEDKDPAMEKFRLITKVLNDLYCEENVKTTEDIKEDGFEESQEKAASKAQQAYGYNEIPQIYDQDQDEFIPDGEMESDQDQPDRRNIKYFLCDGVMVPYYDDNSDEDDFEDEDYDEEDPDEDWDDDYDPDEDYDEEDPDEDWDDDYDPDEDYEDEDMPFLDPYDMLDDALASYDTRNMSPQEYNELVGRLQSEIFAYLDQFEDEDRYPYPEPDLPF